MLDLRSSDLVVAFRRELELCAVKPQEHVAVLAEPSSRGDYVSAAYAAATTLGAHAVVITVAGGSAAPSPSTHTGAGPGLVSVLENTAVQGFLKSVDMIVDLTREGFIHAPVQQEIQQAGTRILFVCDAPDVLIRNLPTRQDKQTVLDAQDLLARSRQLRVTSPAGTDFTASLDDAHPGGQKGFVDEPGQWDHWPSTMVLCWPQTSSGTIVLTAGDIILPFKEYVRSDVHLQIVDGQIVDLSGGGDAAILRLFMDDSGDKWARYLSHMGWGLMRSADWFATAMYSKHEIMGMDARAHAGNFLWSTGPHPFLGRDSYAHLDIAMRGCTVTVDDVVVVDDGALPTDIGDPR